MKNYAKKYFLGAFLIFLTSCLYRKPIEIVISSKKLELTNSPLLIKSSTPFSSQRKLNYIGLFLAKKWSLEKSSEGKIRFEDGSTANIKIVLIDNSGIRYRAGNYGMAGWKFAAYYNIPKNIKITKVEITSSVNLYCNKVVWYCFNPI